MTIEKLIEEFDEVIYATADAITGRDGVVCPIGSIDFKLHTQRIKAYLEQVYNQAHNAGKEEENKRVANIIETGPFSDEQKHDLRYIFSAITKK